MHNIESMNYPISDLTDIELMGNLLIMIRYGCCFELSRGYQCDYCAIQYAAIVKDAASKNTFTTCAAFQTQYDDKVPASSTLIILYSLLA